MTHSAHLAPPAGLPTAQPVEPARRPGWILLALAVAFGPLLGRLVFDEHLVALITYVVNALHLDYEQRAAIHAVRLAGHVLVPVCVAFAVLRVTPLGRWLVVTRIALVGLLVADAIILMASTEQLLRYTSGLLWPRIAGDGAAMVAGGALLVAALSLVIATAWHRSSAYRIKLEKLGRWCAGEV